MSYGKEIAILGGGPAGLAVGYYAKKNGLAFKIYEARDRIGGNSITIREDGFFFDSGAHRFHDRNKEITEEIKGILKKGGGFDKIRIPSQIYYKGRHIEFPLSLLNLTKGLDLFYVTKAALGLVVQRLKAKRQIKDFEDMALHDYGFPIAKDFLLDYSQKLWGLPCNRLSPDIAGERLKGLSLRTLVKETFFKENVRVEHLEGSFYYPDEGIGSITEELADFCGEDNIVKNSKVTKILHDNKQIKAIEINNSRIIETAEVMSSLPISVLLQIMEPSPPDETLFLSRTLSYRNMILVVFFLNTNSVTKAATVYFPENRFPFTRIYEPKNRSRYMAPEGKTSLVIEIPCQERDLFWNKADAELIESVRTNLAEIGYMASKDVIKAMVYRLHYAYPVLEVGVKEKLKKIRAFLRCFSNLKISGRSGKFIYAWIHDMMQFGKVIVEEYLKEA